MGGWTCEGDDKMKLEGICTFRAEKKKKNSVVFLGRMGKSKKNFFGFFLINNFILEGGDFVLYFVL